MPTSLRRCVSLGAAALMVGCGSPSAPQLPSIQTVDDLRTALAEAGAVVESGDTHPPGLFSVPGQELTVDGTPTAAYQFADEASAEAEVSRLEQALILWVAPVRLYRSGPVLLLVVGGTPWLRARVARVMGPPVAGVG